MKTERYIRRQRWLAASRVLSWAMVAILVLLLPACARREATLGILAGALIDGTGGPFRRDALIVTEGRSVREIVPAAERKTYRFDKFIDASGQHVIPGLFDMHGHVTMTRRTLSSLVGSDFANPNTLPGLSLHQEMELLVGAGIPANVVLRMATHDAAQWLGILDKVGTLEPGKQADLVILSRDPLENIRNSRTIVGVVQAGRITNHADSSD